MNVLIAGSRSVTDRDVVFAAIESCGFEITTVLSGGARGVDRLSEEWAELHGIPVKRIRPDWSIGRHAGLLANAEFVARCDAAVIIYDGTSKCAQDTIRKLIKAGKPASIVLCDPGAD